MFQFFCPLQKDEPPSGGNGVSYGHTKGVFGYNDNDQTGFFLIHSWYTLSISFINVMYSQLICNAYLVFYLGLNFQISMVIHTI